MKNQPQLFFSYRKQDANLVRALANWGRASGIDVWLDEYAVPLYTSGGEPNEGDYWKQLVEKGIRESQFIVVFTNEPWILSDACCWEFDIASEVHSADRILQVCVPDERDSFDRHRVLQDWERTLIWSSCEEFATFLEKYSCLRLDPAYSLDALREKVQSWPVTKGFLTSLCLPACQRETRHFCPNEGWPHQVMYAYGLHIPEMTETIDVNVCENPHLNLLKERVQALDLFAANQPRDEVIQKGYRDIARTFLEKHDGSDWLGTHQVWHGDRCHFSITYSMPSSLNKAGINTIERLYSIQWLDVHGAVKGEVKVTFRLSLGSSQSSGISLARFSLLTDAIMDTFAIPQRMAHCHLDRIVSSRQKFMIGTVLGLDVLLILLSSPLLPVAAMVTGWLFSLSAAYRLARQYRDATRRDAFISPVWVFVFARISAPIFVWILLYAISPNIAKDFLWCCLIGLLVAVLYANLQGALSRSDGGSRQV